MFLIASVLFIMATINYTVLYWLPKLLDIEDDVGVAPILEVRDSPCIKLDRVDCFWFNHWIVGTRRTTNIHFQ